MRAVLPEPTGLRWVSGWTGGTGWKDIPSYPNCEGPLLPVASFYYGHLAVSVGARSVEDVVRVAVVGCGAIGVGVR